MKVCDQNCGPDPPGTLQSQHGEKGASGTGLKRKLLSVKERSEKIASNDGHDSREEGAQCSSANAEPKRFVRKHNGFRIDTLADQGNNEKELFAEEEFRRKLQFSQTPIRDAHIDTNAIFALDSRRLVYKQTHKGTEGL